LDEHPAAYELVHGCNMAVRSDDARHVGGWDTAFDGAFGYEDIEFAARLVRHGCEVTWVRGATVLHLEDEGDTSWKASRSVNFERACRVIPGFRLHRSGSRRQVVLG
jgi:GT2 family glycosyltransferase